MLTGDAKKNAEMVAKEAGIDICYAKQLPQDKLNNLSKIRGGKRCRYVCRRWNK